MLLHSRERQSKVAPKLVCMHRAERGTSILRQLEDANPPLADPSLAAPQAVTPPGCRRGRFSPPGLPERSRTVPVSR